MSFPTVHNEERIREMMQLLNQIEEGSEGEDVEIGTLPALMKWLFADPDSTPRDFLAEQGLDRYF